MSRGGFLGRWSERKQANRRGRAAPVAVAEPRVDADPGATDEEPTSLATLGAAPASSPPTVADAISSEEPDEQALREQATAAGLPTIEELDAESDYTGFLGSEVPETLRRAALRKLWRSDPVLANLDGLNDYDLDYNLVDKVLSVAQEGGEMVEKLVSGETGRSDEPVDGKVTKHATQSAPLDDPRSGTATEADEPERNGDDPPAA